MAKKGKQRSLGIVPRALLRGAIVGAIPACALTGCASDSGSLDPDASRADAAADIRVFAVDAPAFSVADLGFHPERPLFSVAAPLRDGGIDAPLFGVADLIVRPDAGADHPDASPDHVFFTVDAPSFKG